MFDISKFSGSESILITSVLRQLEQLIAFGSDKQKNQSIDQVINVLLVQFEVTGFNNIKLKKHTLAGAYSLLCEYYPETKVLAGFIAVADVTKDVEIKKLLDAIVKEKPHKIVTTEDQLKKIGFITQEAVSFSSGFKDSLRNAKYIGKKGEEILSKEAMAAIPEQLQGFLIKLYKAYTEQEPSPDLIEALQFIETAKDYINSKLKDLLKLKELNADVILGLFIEAREFILKKAKEINQGKNVEAEINARYPNEKLIDFIKTLKSPQTDFRVLDAIGKYHQGETEILLNYITNCLIVQSQEQYSVQAVKFGTKKSEITQEVREALDGSLIYYYKAPLKGLVLLDTEDNPYYLVRYADKGLWLTPESPEDFDNHETIMTVELIVSQGNESQRYQHQYEIRLMQPVIDPKASSAIKATDSASSEGKKKEDLEEILLTFEGPQLVFGQPLNRLLKNLEMQEAKKTEEAKIAREEHHKHSVTQKFSLSAPLPKRSLKKSTKTLKETYSIPAISTRFSPAGTKQSPASKNPLKDSSKDSPTSPTNTNKSPPSNTVKR